MANSRQDNTKTAKTVPGLEEMTRVIEITRKVSGVLKRQPTFTYSQWRLTQEEWQLIQTLRF